MKEKLGEWLVRWWVAEEIGQRLVTGQQLERRQKSGTLQEIIAY